MKKYLIAGMACFLPFAYAQAQTVSDKQNIDNANMAITRNDCKEALQSLGGVSKEGIATPPYLLAMAKANECSGYKNAAVIYFEKYIALVPSDEDAKKRLAILKSEKVKPTEEEQVTYPLLFGEPKKRKWEDRNKIIEDDMFYITSVNYGIWTGGSDAPQKKYFSLNNDFLKPIIHNRVVYGFAVDAGLLTGPNPAWYAHALNTSSDSILKLKKSIALGLGFSFAAVLLSEERIAITLGPTATIRAIIPTGNIGAKDNTSEMPVMLPYYAGLKTNIYYGRFLSLSLEYNYGLRSRFTNKQADPLPTVTPVNYKMLRIGIGYYTFW